MAAGPLGCYRHLGVGKSKSLPNAKCQTTVKFAAGWVKVASDFRPKAGSDQTFGRKSHATFNTMTVLTLAIIANQNMKFIVFEILCIIDGATASFDFA